MVPYFFLLYRSGRLARPCTIMLFYNNVILLCFSLISLAMYLHLQSARARFNGSVRHLHNNINLRDLQCICIFTCHAFILFWIQRNSNGFSLSLSLSLSSVDLQDNSFQSFVACSFMLWPSLEMRNRNEKQIKSHSSVKCLSDEAMNNDL